MKTKIAAPVSKPTPEIRRIEARDLAQVAELHLQCLNTRFSRLAGRRLLALYYASFLRQRNGAAFVAVEHGRVVGFVVGIWDWPRVIHRLVSVRFLPAVFWGLVESCVNPGLVFHWLSHRRKLAETKESGYVLRPLVVDPAQRGRGIGAILTRRIMEDARVRGYRAISLLVRPENAPAVRCYNNLGFHTAATDPYGRLVMTAALDPARPTAGFQGKTVVFVGAVSDQSLFTGLFSVWSAHGHEVEIWSEMSERTYRSAGSLVARIWMRVRVNIVFLLRAGWRMVADGRNEGRIIVVASTPFTAPALISWLKRPQDVVIQLLYDLYPDALIVAAKVRPNSVAARAMAAVVGRGLRKCDVSVFPGERLRAYTDRTYGPCPRSVVIPVGTDVGSLAHQRTELGAGPVKIVYVGNLGYMHDYRTLADLLREGLPAGVRLVFHASGYNYDCLQAERAQWPEETRDRVEFGASLPHAQWVQVMQEADVGLVLFKTGAEKVAFPSKTFSAMAAGQAILGVAPLASDFADTVLSHECGWISEPGDLAGLRRNLETIVADRAALVRKKQAAVAIAAEQFDVGRLALRWMELFGELTAVPANAPASQLSSNRPSP